MKKIPEVTSGVNGYNGFRHMANTMYNKETKIWQPRRSMESIWATIG
jgi:hypothetical protein